MPARVSALLPEKGTIIENARNILALLVAFSSRVVPPNIERAVDIALVHAVTLEAVASSQPFYNLISANISLKFGQQQAGKQQAGKQILSLPGACQRCCDAMRYACMWAESSSKGVYV